MVLLSGEAGIGKSRLVMALKEYVAGEPHTRWSVAVRRTSRTARSIPDRSVATGTCSLAGTSRLETKLQKLEVALVRYTPPQPDTVALWAALLSIPLADSYPPLNPTPQRQQQQTLEAIVALLLALAAEQPVQFIIEDVHWIDPSTLEFLTLLIDQVPTACLLTLLTCRPEFSAPWGFRAHLTPLTPTRSSAPGGPDECAGWRATKPCPRRWLSRSWPRPMACRCFSEELTKTVLESGLLREGEERYELTWLPPPLAIPTTLHDSLMARLDRLATVKDVAQLGATIGRTFAYESIAGGLSLDTATLQHSLRQLVEANWCTSGGAAAGDLHVQACAHPGRGVSVAAAEHPTAVSPSVLRRRIGGFPRRSRRNRNCWRITTPKQA